MARQVRSFFARNAIVDVRSLGATARVDSLSNFYLTQTPRSPASGSEQFLFRGTPAQVSSLVEEMSRPDRRNVQVSLITPVLQADGWERANLAAQMLRRGPGAPRRMAKADRPEAQDVSVESRAPAGVQGPAEDRTVGLAASQGVSSGTSLPKELAERARWLGALHRESQAAKETPPPAASQPAGSGVSPPSSGEDHRAHPAPQAAAERQQTVQSAPTQVAPSAPAQQQLRRVDLSQAQAGVGTEEPRPPGQISQARSVLREDRPQDHLVTVVITVQSASKPDERSPSNR